jgi:uncharacterized protein (DUF1330 family)
MAGYVIAEVEVHDPEAYEAYRSGVLATLQPFGGQFLVRGGNVELLEGEGVPRRLVIIEFPSVERARDWYTSPAYREILPIRFRHAESRLLLVEGV